MPGLKVKDLFVNDNRKEEMKVEVGTKEKHFEPVCIGEKTNLLPIAMWNFQELIEDGIFSLLKDLQMCSIENLRHYAAEEPEVLKRDFVELYVKSHDGELGTFKGNILKREGGQIFDEAFKKSPYRKITSEIGLKRLNNLVITNEGVVYTDEYVYKANHEFITDERVYETYKKLLKLVDDLNELISKVDNYSLLYISPSSLFSVRDGKFTLSGQARTNMFLTVLSGLDKF